MLPQDQVKRGFDEHQCWSGATIAKYEQEWKGLVAAALQSSKNRGYMPGELEEAIAHVLEPVIDWHSVIWQFVSSFSRDDYRWSPPNRHYIHAGMYLPSLKSESVELGIAIDTSASVNSNQLQRFVSEAQAILELNTRVTLHYFECDAAVQKSVELHSGDDLLSVVGKIKGRGGTRFTPVFEWIAHHEGVVNVAGLIWLTDMMGEFPPVAPEYPVLWVSCSDIKKAPFGEVVQIPMEEY
jgi:predicted metal-dependent peptidase